MASAKIHQPEQADVRQEEQTQRSALLTERSCRAGSQSELQLGHYMARVNTGTSTPQAALYAKWRQRLPLRSVIKSAGKFLRF